MPEHTTESEAPTQPQSASASRDVTSGSETSQLEVSREEASRLASLRTTYSQTVRFVTSPRMQRLMDTLHAGRWLVVTAMAMVSLLVIAVPEVEMIQEELVIFFVMVALMVMGYKPEEAFDRATREMTEEEIRDEINRQVHDMLEDMQREETRRDDIRRA